MVERLLSIIAPHSCCSCGNLGSILCQSCKNDINFEPFPACFVCLAPTLDTNICLACKASLGLEAGWVVGTREGYLKALLDHYKFNSAKEAGVACAELLNTRLPLIPQEVVVVPVPTSPAHMRVRGFDHTALITSRFARSRHLTSQRVLVRRSNDTQHFKSRSERLKVTADHLEVVGVTPRSVLLVDDIYTTGATLRACIRKLKDAGVRQVYVAIIARQTLDEMSDL